MTDLQLFISPSRIAWIMALHPILKQIFLSPSVLFLPVHMSLSRLSLSQKHDSLSVSCVCHGRSYVVHKCRFPSPVVVATLQCFYSVHLIYRHQSCLADGHFNLSAIFCRMQLWERLHPGSIHKPTDRIERINISV